MQLLGVEPAEPLVGQQGERGLGMLEGWESPSLSQNSGMCSGLCSENFPDEGGMGEAFAFWVDFFLIAPGRSTVLKLS